MYYELLFYCLLTSLVSVGFFLASLKGNILHFIVKPVYDLLDNIELERNKALAEVNEQEGDSEHFIDPTSYKEYFMDRRNRIRESYNKEITFFENVFKPVFLCPRCMASVWSFFIWFPLTVNQFGYPTAWSFILPAIFISVTLNTLIFKNTGE